MLTFKSFITESEESDSLSVGKFRVHSHIHEGDPEFTHEHNVQNMLFGSNDYLPFGQYSHNMGIIESVEPHPTNPKRLIFRVGDVNAKGPYGLSVPRHMWEGGKGRKGEDGEATPSKGMRERNEMRANVYGQDHRAPLEVGGIERVHKAHMDEHFKKPEHEQIQAETDAIGRLQKAGHLDSGSTLDKGEKTDTVQHEYDEQGRSHRAASSKGVAGHALYTSGSGENQIHHILNTCNAQTRGCGGGVDADNIADTTKGSCFAPKAESQYVNAAVRRACHEQAKHDPAMTRDWALAHTHSLRKAAETADKKNERFLFRPNVVDETDRSSRTIIKGLNKQRKTKGKPAIIANSYGKTNEMHDPENDYHVTYSNTGPKVKHGSTVSENIKRDSTRIAQTTTATNKSGVPLKNDEGKSVPTKNSYLVTNMKRGSDMDRAFQQNVTHAKYWSAGRKDTDLSEKEKSEGLEAHYDGNGKITTDTSKAHYGHVTIKGSDGIHRRYDYQKQHVLHPRLVSIGKVTKKNKKTGEVHEEEHIIPTDSRFKDNDFLPKEENRFKSKNGRSAGALVITTPTTSTSDVQHHSEFTHHVDESHIAHAKAHHGEYEIDKPEDQEAARGQSYLAPKDPPKKGYDLHLRSLWNKYAKGEIDADGKKPGEAKEKMAAIQTDQAAKNKAMKENPAYQDKLAALKASKLAAFKNK